MSNIKDIDFYYAGQEKCRPGHSCAGIRDHYLIHYVLSGKGIFETEDRTYDLDKGNGFLIVPEQSYLYKADKNQPWEYCWFAFIGLQTENFLKQIDLTVKNPVFRYTKDNLIKTSITNMIKGYKIKKGRNFYMISQIYNFFYALAQLKKKSFPEQQKKIENITQLYLKSALSFIEKNYSRHMNIQELADYIGLERKYFSTLFKKHVKISPQEYLIKFRMDKAGQLLKKTDLSVALAANSVGYRDALGFSKIFRQYKGLCPTDYRDSLN